MLVIHHGYTNVTGICTAIRLSAAGELLGTTPARVGTFEQFARETHDWGCGRAYRRQTRMGGKSEPGDRAYATRDDDLFALSGVFAAGCRGRWRSGRVSRPDQLSDRSRV